VIASLNCHSPFYLNQRHPLQNLNLFRQLGLIIPQSGKFHFHLTVSTEGFTKDWALAVNGRARLVLLVLKRTFLLE